MTSFSKSKVRRFYEKTTVSRLNDEDYLVELDERPLKTPAGALARLPNATLAEAVADEWRAQGDAVALAAMPLTQLTFAAIDQGEAQSASLAKEVARFAASDLLCYPAENPASLIALQANQWDPWLAWARETLGVDLASSRGIIPLAQAARALSRVEALAQAQGPYALVAVVRACGLFGSAVLALALARGDLSGDAANDLARLDETWQEKQWGIDPEAAVRARARLGEARDLERWFLALGANER